MDCMITLPGQLFHSTQIPACLWFLARNKNPGNGWHDRRGEVLFINARKLGHMVDRTRREFSDEDIARIAGTSHAWRKESGAEACEDEPGYCNAATLEEIGKHNHVLTPGRHVGAAAMESLVGERTENGRFRDVGDLADRLGAGVVNKRQMEHLIKAGALDSLNPNRRQLFEGVDAITRLAARAADDRSSNQVSLFGDDPAAAGAALRLPDVPDWALTDRLRHEFDAVGVYLSAHPLDSYAKSLEKLGAVPYARLIEMAQAGDPPSVAKLAGTVIGRKERRNAKGNKFAFVQLSDASGIYEVTVFSEALAQSRDLLDDAAETNAPVLVNADVRIEDGESIRLLVRSFATLDSAAARSTRGFRIFLGGDEAIGPLHGLLDREQGGHGTVDLVVPWGEREAEVRLRTTIPTAPAVHQAIKSIPGIVHVEEV